MVSYSAFLVRVVELDERLGDIGAQSIKCRYPAVRVALVRRLELGCLQVLLGEVQDADSGRYVCAGICQSDGRIGQCGVW